MAKMRRPSGGKGVGQGWRGRLLLPEIVGGQRSLDHSAVHAGPMVRPRLPAGGNHAVQLGAAEVQRGAILAGVAGAQALGEETVIGTPAGGLAVAVDGGGVRQ